jgi:hypothetical protein
MEVVGGGRRQHPSFKAGVPRGRWLEVEEGEGQYGHTKHCSGVPLFENGKSVKPISMLAKE